MDAAVIIPTHAGRAGICALLDRLSAACASGLEIEAIVVQNGRESSASAEAGDGGVHPPALPFRVVRQREADAASARNLGARHARGDVLVFMDDDIAPSPRAIGLLVSAARARPDAIVLGSLLTRPEGPPSRYSARLCAYEARARELERAHAVDGLVELPFTACMSGLLAIRASTFAHIGMFVDPTGGWPSWDDVEYGYRAHLAGHRLLRHVDAVADHLDASAAELRTSCERWYRASHAAATLFERRPALAPLIPMFHDKAPARWGSDPTALVLRKALRRCSATRPVVAALECAAMAAERVLPLPAILDPLYRWTTGAYICRGYRAGLAGRGRT